MSDLLSFARDILSVGEGVGSHCLWPFAVWTGGSAAVGIVVGLGVYLTVIRPVVRWSRARTDALGCLASGLLVLGGLLGGTWCGLLIGGDRCLRSAVDDGYLLEELSLHTVVGLATEGRPSENPEELAAQLEDLLVTAEGSVEGLLETILEEIDAEHPALEVHELIPPEIFDDLASSLDQTGFADPASLAHMYRGGGVRAALSSDDDELATAAQNLVDTTAVARKHLVLAIDATFLPLAVVGPILGYGLPLILILSAALITRLFREGDPAPPTS